MSGDSDVPLHRPVPAHDLPATGRPFRIDAGVDERRALAQRFDLIAVDNLWAEGIVRPEAAGRRIRVEGRLVADVVQTCVVSLDPVPSHIDAAFDRLYGRDVGEEWEEGAGDAVFVDLGGDLLAEPLDSDVLDLGVAAAEQLALELDPYPRKPGALFTGCDRGEETGASAAPDGPLARLSGWHARGSRGREG
jgi:hypothetical protein